MNYNAKIEYLKICRTKDFSFFAYFEENRIVNTKNRSDLVDSFKRNKGWPKTIPALVFEDDKKLWIIDGQNRIQIAKNMGIDVWYTLFEGTREQAIRLMKDLQASKKWGYDDYVHHNIAKSNPDYMLLDKLSKDYSIHIATAACILMGRLPSGGKESREDVYEGYFKATHIDYFYAVAAIHDAFKAFPLVYKKKSLIIACAKLACVKSFNLSRLVININKKCSSKIKNVGTWDNYLTMIETIYNWMESEKDKDLTIAALSKNAYAAHFNEMYPVNKEDK
jgi:hypothetical protein